MHNQITSFEIPKKGIYFMSLGGIGEIGANSYLYSCDDKWIMIDLGLTFADEKFPGIDLLLPKIDFIDENKPLGTAGSLRFIKKFKKPVFVTNCDILLKANYYDILQNHKKSKNDLTLVVSTKELSLPYGSCNLSKKGDLISIIEKP